MTPLRRRLATSIVVGLIVTHALVLWRDRDSWPFCAYGMYSWIEDRTVESYRLVGLAEGAGDREVVLWDSPSLHRLNQVRLSEALRAMRRRPDGPQRIRDATRDALRRYEVRRRAGLHDGLRLLGMRAYWTRHEIGPAQNLERPPQRRLIAEVLLPTRGAAP